MEGLSADSVMLLFNGRTRSEIQTSDSQSMGYYYSVTLFVVSFWDIWLNLFI